jgi:hypothetical protein
MIPSVLSFLSLISIEATWAYSRRATNTKYRKNIHPKTLWKASFCHLPHLRPTQAESRFQFCQSAKGEDEDAHLTGNKAELMPVYHIYVFQICGEISAMARQARHICPASPRANYLGSTCDHLRCYHRAAGKIYSFLGLES